MEMWTSTCSQEFYKSYQRKLRKELIGREIDARQSSLAEYAA